MAVCFDENLTWKLFIISYMILELTEARKSVFCLEPISFVTYLLNKKDLVVITSQHYFAVKTLYAAKGGVFPH
jgi:hypothetical protein